MSKLEEKELENLRSSINAINSLQLQIGGLEAQKHEVLHAITDASDNFKKLQESLEVKYGKVDIDISTGKITEKDELSKED
jgi:uncharacterized protein YggE|tara:strand:+ start:9506 stop:9748 length:243 start_codon:yes stop_codon:yes gene_type:complete